jgi:hypothetical protein
MKRPTLGSQWFEGGSRDEGLYVVE